MTLREKYENLQNDFKDLIFRGEYEILEVDAYSALLKIDDFYFTIWLSNGEKSVEMQQGASVTDECITLNFSDEQKQKLYGELNPARLAAKKKDLQDKLDEL